MSLEVTKIQKIPKNPFAKKAKICQKSKKKCQKSKNLPKKQTFAKQAKFFQKIQKKQKQKTASSAALTAKNFQKPKIFQNIQKKAKKSQKSQICTKSLNMPKKPKKIQKRPPLQPPRPLLPDRVEGPGTFVTNSETDFGGSEKTRT
jgi:hypothetical protein